MATVGGLPAYNTLRGVVNLLEPATNYFPNLHGTARNRRQMPATKSHVRKKGLICTNPCGAAEGATSLYAAVYVFPVSHLHYEDEQSFIPNLINDAVVLPRPNIDAIELLLRLHLYHAMRAWILFELFYVGEDLSTDTQVQFLKLPERGRSELQGVGRLLGICHRASLAGARWPIGPGASWLPQVRWSPFLPLPPELRERLPGRFGPFPPGPDAPTDGDLLSG